MISLLTTRPPRKSQGAQVKEEPAHVRRAGSLDVFGAVPLFAGNKSHFWAENHMFFLGKSHLFAGKSHYFAGESPFLMDKLNINGDFQVRKLLVYQKGTNWGPLNMGIGIFCGDISIILFDVIHEVLRNKMISMGLEKVFTCNPWLAILWWNMMISHWIKKTNGTIFSDKSKWGDEWIWIDFDSSS